MLDWLFNRTPTPGDFSLLETDMHAHWLPGIDDGAATLEDSVEMIRELVDLGYKRLIATPHVLEEFYPNRPPVIREKLALVRDAIRKEGIEVELSAAAEYMIDEKFEWQAKEFGLLTLPGNRVLVEFGFYAPPADLEGILFRLQAARYQPVIAHPERYRYYHGKREQLEKFHSMGIELQVNLLSLMGHYGKRVKREAERLMDSGTVTLLGTDAHNSDHISSLASAIQSRSFAAWLQNAGIKNSELEESGS